MAALSAFAKFVRPSVPGCPEPVLLDGILRACIEYCTRTKSITQDVSVITAASTNGYAIPVSSGYEPVEVNRVMRSGYDLDPSSLNEAHQMRLTQRNDMPRVFWMDENNLLQFAPTPNAIETLEVIAAVTPSMAATSVPDALLSNTRYDAICAGARAFLMALPKVEWSDLQQSAVDRAAFQAAIEKEILKRARGGSHKPLRTKSSFY